MVSATECCSLSRNGSNATSDSHQGSDDTADLLKVYLEYMRAPSPEDELTSRYWNQDSDSMAQTITSSPILSCPPSWLHDANDENENDDLESENDDDRVLCEVPLSSSPPDLTSSSPQSGESDASDDYFTSTSASSDELHNPVALSQPTSSCVDLSADASLGSYDDFGKRLHCLLLFAMKEMEREQALHSEREGTDSLAGSESGDSEQDSIDTFGPHGVSVEETNYSPICSLEPSYVLTPKQVSEETHSEVLEEISPLRFASQTVSDDLQSTDSEQPKAYRLIKRSQSHVSNEHMEEPSTKRQKVSREHGPIAKKRIYAHRTASLRRADSLKAVPGGDNVSASSNCNFTSVGSNISTVFRLL
ncbi:hypothetical protein BDN70DRAFT_107219 [Pholiota conissans]|uniref:Uncharacterized protein n=1 Tax=Pholiota conissans TaxID=109636 RepID=A0A9P5ZCW6_9AGAR|nr:hypothetical protein BDN70DRAFT_107219 [Pholiota conissans]